MAGVMAVFWAASIIMTGWVARDAARRHRSWFGWAFLVGNTSVLGLILWLYVRRRGASPDGPLSPLRGRLLWLAVIPVAVVNVLIGAFVVTFLFQIARIDGQAMAPTLNAYDRVVINKWIYRFHPPRRGDVVMLRYPIDRQKLFVKRVIGVDGDTVRIADGHVYVNEVPLQDDYVPADFRSHDDWGPLAIREGFFVLGDHRNNSSDSRHWGILPRNDVIGRVQLDWRLKSATPP